jgi:thiamine-phosphate pyrophosphorylase
MHHKLPRGFYALIDDQVRAEMSVVDKARAAIDGGARVLQLRLEQTPDRPALEACRAVVGLARPGGVVVLVNDRVDLALLSGADGVHLGADDLPVADARHLLGAAALIGATTRNLSQIQRAAGEGADHVGLGPVFATTTKQVDAPPLGLEGLEAICRRSPLAVVAIGGITLETIGQVARAGAWCAAVAGDFLRAEAPVSRARALQRAFSEA